MATIFLVLLLMLYFRRDFEFPGGEETTSLQQSITLYKPNHKRLCRLVPILCIIRTQLQIGPVWKTCSAFWFEAPHQETLNVLSSHTKFQVSIAV